MMQRSESPSISSNIPVVGQVHGLTHKSPSPMKKKLKKLRKCDFQIDWRRKDVILSLFKAIIAKEPHLKTSNADKNKAWGETRDMLFMQDVMIEYADLKDTENVIRNMKHNFKQKYESVLGELGVGDFNGGKPSNLSRFDGELGPLETLVKQIYIDQEAAAEKKEIDDPKKVLNEIESDSWKVTQSKPLRVKNVKGVVTDNSVSKLSRQSKTFDTVKFVVYDA